MRYFTANRNSDSDLLENSTNSVHSVSRNKDFRTIVQRKSLASVVYNDNKTNVNLIWLTK